ncbi:putative lyase [Microlunatus phosphovorus NM-1]|uniref:Putative lyase n=1 Tax=Microlunatus phosphovorus (strain ATCC 700054 / DSM 10555 / JCM 9379 / NBRC 101784 / NCIMB 13414 / VKM Ac-1990 / NM-1) TaxID=1032480 RepID=F5XMV2_MICPN|nr:CoA ester lyase [Microlunatus phosphovorus]BAK34025.1 putative lyase [Microlunatus phosphovorus NM-1]
MSDWFPGPAWLFCPADRPDRYAKALSRADLVIVDLEDAVAPANRPAARDALRRLAHDGVLDPDRTLVRINGTQSGDHPLDLAVLAEVGLPRAMLAKSEDPVQLAAIEHEVVLLVETPRGIERIAELAAQDNVIGAMWGADDLVAGLGGTTSRHPDGRYRDVARFARSRALIAAKAAGRLAVDAVHMDIADTAGLAAECEDAVASGFDATAAIHPSQVPIIRTAYAPSPGQVDWATRLLAHVGEDRGVTTFEGRMVDGPVYTQAERVLRLAATAIPAGDS